MNDDCRSRPTVLIVLGAAGDLAWRKLVPALYNLQCSDRLIERLALVGVDRRPMEDAEFRDRLRDGVERFSGGEQLNREHWERFASLVSYQAMDINDAQGYAALEERLDRIDANWKQDEKTRRVFYLAVPPSLVGAIVENLHRIGLNRPTERVRIVVEKPFGHDLASARQLNTILDRSFAESQIYRIDHYLGKETVQNILAFRFANGLFEPIWDRRYIDHVQITVAEDIGIEHRGGYYDRAGALRDMVQNHLLQILTLIAMEPPVSFEADEIRSKKLDVLRAVRPIPPRAVHRFAARGQYGPGWIRGEQVPGYRQEPDVNEQSTTETYAALKLLVDNWRWQDVPFYLRTGKRLPERVSAVSIEFRPVPHQSFPGDAIADWQPNRLVVHIQPDEGITLRFLVQRPELSVRLSPAEMRFDYLEAFGEKGPDAYETLLLDIICGDQTLFKRSEQVEAAWELVAPILDNWAAMPPVELPNYAAGTWGPETADILIAQDGRRWLAPVRLRERSEG